MTTASARPHLKQHAAPDLSDFRRRYPLTVASFGALANREAWLRRIWELDAHWQHALTPWGSREQAQAEYIVRGAPPVGLMVEAEFEIIYEGGMLGLLHAAVMACHYHRRVMVFDHQTVGQTDRDWNISDEELRQLERVQLFTKEEIESAVSNRYRSGFVKFHDAGSRVKTPPLWVNGVLDVALDARQLLDAATEKLRLAPGAAMMDGLRFVRCYVQPHRTVVEVEETRTGRHCLFAARLFVDATATNSAVARQLNRGRTVTHVSPTVGTVSRGFVRGEEPDKVDFSVGEIMVSNEDARDHRQLIWEGFAGSPRRDEYTTYLFFYDAVDSPADKSLLALFERYFDSLPGYKRAGAQWRVLKPVFGYLPSFHQHGRMGRHRTADDRVMLVGDAAAGLQTPLTFCNFGSHVRNLQRLTHLTDLALEADLLDAASLSEINMDEPRVAQVASLAEFLRPMPRSAPSTVNETLNAVMAALHSLDERVRRELFQDRMTLSALKNLLSRTIQLYPRILQRMREHLGARGTFWWLANVAEVVLHERRERSALPPGDVEKDEEAEKKFARYVSLYKNQ